MSDWWVFVDLGGGDGIVQADEPPMPEFTGPYSTFTEARQGAIDQITYELDEIKSRLQYWRRTSKKAILAECEWVSNDG